MVDAGRILIMPKGIWSNLVSYEMLDVVTQDNIAYLARQSSVGVSPKNDSSYTYWQPFGTSVTPDGETIIMNSAGNITANIDNKSLVYDDVNMYVKVAIDGSTIKYDSKNGYLYVDASNFNINDLNNIAITSPADGQTLVYDSTTQKWKNGEGSVSPIDNLTSNSTTQPLSANQGRVLNNQKLEKEIISDAWNASTTYAVGQYCIYNNSLWKCLVQHSGQTPTEGTYWTKVTVANEITSVNNSLNVRYNEDTDTIQIYFGGKWLDWYSADMQIYALLRNGVISESGYVSYSEENSFAKFENGVIKIGATNTVICHLAFALKEQIDLSQYTKLIINVSTCSKPISVRYANSLPTSYNWPSTELGKIIQMGTIEFDLTEINSLAYIGFDNSNLDAGETWIDSIILK